MTVIDMPAAKPTPRVIIPTMFHPQDDGTLIRIPAEDAAVLNRYRDGDEPHGDDRTVCLRYYPEMPLVYEPQYFGDPCPLYPLIDDIDEKGRYACYPMPGTVEMVDGRPVLTVMMPPAVAA